MEKIGIMGGTFDPIHNGHLMAAEEVRQKLELDRIIFVPAGMPPLKSAHKIAEARHRHNMCLLAVAGNPYFTVSDIETVREGISYTFDTISQLCQIYPNDRLFFIVGADVPSGFHRWKNFEGITALCDIVVTTRPGHKIGKNLRDKYSDILHIIEISDVDISSTKIRQSLAEGLPVRYLLPDGVVDYICKNRLYGSWLGQIKDKLEKELGRRRFLHSLLVMEEAVKLGRHYSCDEDTLESLRIAALLHDCARPFCSEQGYPAVVALCERDGIALDPFFKTNLPLTHSVVGTILAKDKYGITDPMVLSAIAGHTFGKSDMSFVDKVVYLSDFIKPDRQPDKVRGEARRLAYEDIDGAMIYALRQTIEKNTALGRDVYRESERALEYLEEKYGKR